MSDKPPEKLFVFFNHVTVRGRILYTGGDTKEQDDDIEYIRADVAKGREAKLIKAAMYYCESLSDAEGFEDAAKLLYEKSEIEELK